MSAVMKSRLWILALFALSVRFCSAQAPSGPVSFSFGADTPVFDLTGSYEFTQQVTETGGTATDISFGVALVNNARGGLSGSGSTLVTIGDGSFAPFAANYVVRGRISGGGAKATRVTLTVRLFGSDTVLGVPNVGIGMTITYNLTVDPVALALNGTSRGQLSLGKLGNSHINSDVGPVLLPQGVDGTWVVQMNILPLNRLAGSGTIIVGNVVDQNLGTVGRSLPEGLTGSFSASANLAKVRLTGNNNGRGTSLILTFAPGGSVDSLSGTILGQKVLISGSGP